MYQYLREPASTHRKECDFVPITDAPALEIFPPVKAAAPAAIAPAAKAGAEQCALASNASSIEVAEAVEKAVDAMP
jgi:hypothetical protein